MCLALYDRDLGLKDRLQAADQYLAMADRSDFEVAAVEDARRHAATALQRKLPPLAIRPPGWVPPHRRLGALAAVLLATALWIGQYSASEASVSETLVAEEIPGDLRRSPDLTQVLPDPLPPRPASLVAKRNAAKRNTEVEVPKSEAESNQSEMETREFSTQRQSTDRKLRRFGRPAQQPGPASAVRRFGPALGTAGAGRERVQEEAVEAKAQGAAEGSSR